MAKYLFSGDDLKAFFNFGERTLADCPAEQVVADALRVREALEQFVWDVRDGGWQCRASSGFIAARRLGCWLLMMRNSVTATAAATAVVTVAVVVVVVERHYCVAVTLQLLSHGYGLSKPNTSFAHLSVRRFSRSN